MPSPCLQGLLDNAPVILYCAAPEGGFHKTFIGGNVQPLLGLHPHDVVAAAALWLAHVHPDDAAGWHAGMAQVLAAGRGTLEYRFRSGSGAWLWLHDSMRVMCGVDGAATEVVGALTDITARKEIEQAQNELVARLRGTHEQLLQSEKMASIGQLAAGIAHEINNPVGFVNSNMGSLRGYMDTLFGVVDAYEQAVAAQPVPPGLPERMAAVRGAADLDFLRRDVAALVRESMDGLKRVKDIVQSLKDFSHVGETEWQVADLHLGLDSTLNIVANEIKYKCTVVKHYGTLPPVECLASQLNQVFMNLLLNAAQAIAGRGTITLRTGAAEGWVWIDIADTGSGIAPAHLHRIFEPFFTTKPVGSGTGLGLSLSYGIVAKHGGHIDVVSAPGRETCFTIHLPVHPPKE